jgi:hypothetical protein
VNEPQIACPNCGHEIKLTESLAAPLIEATRKQFQQQLANKDAEVARERAALRQQQDELAKARETIEDQVVARLKTERAGIAAAEAKKAKEATANEIESKTKQLGEMQQLLDQNNIKLAEAQKAQADMLKKQRDLDEKLREADLTVQKRVQDELSAIHIKARKDAEEVFLLKVAEKDKQLADMSRTVEDLRRKAEQGSQQTQGEVLELALEDLLRNRFPQDIIEPVGKGEFGGDVVQYVNGAMGATSGTILWEFKRTKNWSDGWLPKLRQDQRNAKADTALIISQALPKDVETFDLIDGVWVAHPRCVLPVAVAIRKSLIDIAALRTSQHGQQTKTEQVYQYLTGPRFKQRVEAVLEKFNDMHKDLDRERTFMQKQWSKRESQLIGVLESTTGLYGDLQGIAGQALPEIESLDMPLLSAPPTPRQS